MKIIRILAILVGFGTVIWQISEWSQGRAQNMFFVADVVIGLYLGLSAFIPSARSAQVNLLAAFGLIAGVFSVATFGALTMGIYDFGPFTTTIGLIISLPCMFVLGRNLIKA